MSSTTKNRPCLTGGNLPRSGKNGRLKTLDDWPTWSKHLSQRKRPLPIAKLISGGKKSPLLWALPQSDGERIAELVRFLSQAGARKRTKKELVERLEQWLDQPRDRPPSVSAAYECLGWCHALPTLAEHLAAGPWWQLLDRLLDVAEQATATNEVTEDPLTDQLLAGELPLAVAYHFPEVEQAGKLAKPACRRISAAIHDLLDGQGFPKAQDLDHLRPLLACWLRCGYMDREMQTQRITGEPALQFDWLVRQAIRIARYDGSQMLGDDSKFSSGKRLVEAAVSFTGDSDDQAIAAHALTNGKAAKEQRKAALPEADARSEWAELAVLRSSWSRGSDRLLVTYAQRQLRSELVSGRSVIWSGNCDPRIEIDGQTIAPSADWEEVCWHADDDVSYFELECQYTSGWKIQRQWFLARQDRLLFVADAVVSSAAAGQRIEYRCTWPLVEGIRFDGEVETREGLLGGEKSLARVIPAALPEWRSERLDSSLGNVDGGLQLFQSGAGRALYAPLFVDLNPRRLDKPLTWRRLTVAEKLEIQPPDVAAGYRIQVGKAQWLIYRSLTPAANRTVLGQNLSTEFYIGRFKKSGDTAELLEIE